MNTINDGGPAFPVPGINLPNDLTVYPLLGMTLRDYFAAKAMQAVPMPQPSLHDTPYAYDRIASHAYKMADAMLRAREGGAA